ncbi:phage tail protein [Pseudomonas sp. IT-P395]|uniref:phage tail protein n=1 Tax=Pseudomonas sp. IT-P395 TaxID=3026459 RepID=UPI0039E1EB77
MIDQNSIFGGMLTTLGAAKKTNCDALGIPWEPRYMLIGDANGTDPVPSPAQTKLINQRYRAQLNQLRVSPTDDNVLIAELVLPPDVGGWWIRELALEDKDGVFSAVANVAPSYKPLLAQGSGRNQVVRMHIITSGTSNIQLKIDPSVVLATREYVDTKILEELYKLDNKQSVRVATTANIALTGLQTIDGVALAAGDRVLVKNQTSAKDNGIWVAAQAGWVRAADADSSAEVTSALLVSVEQGATLADSRWQLITDGTIALGTTSLTFQNVTYGLAALYSPAFLGTPTVPTPAQFDASLLAVNAAFVQRALGNFSGQTSINAPTAALSPTLAGRRIVVTGPATLTLPLLSASPSGSKFYIQNIGTGDVVVTRQGADIIVALARSLNSVTIPMQSNGVIACGDTNYVFEEGVAALKYAPEFAAVMGTGAANQQLPGLIIKAGNVSNASNAATIPLTFPVSFPNACVALVLTPWQTGGSAYSHNGRDKSGATISRGANANFYFDYMAIGY